MLLRIFYEERVQVLKCCVRTKLAESHLLWIKFFFTHWDNEALSEEILFFSGQRGNDIPTMWICFNFFLEHIEFPFIEIVSFFGSFGKQKLFVETQKKNCSVSSDKPDGCGYFTGASRFYSKSLEKHHFSAAESFVENLFFLARLGYKRRFSFGSKHPKLLFDEKQELQRKKDLVWLQLSSRWLSLCTIQLLILQNISC